MRLSVGENRRGARRGLNYFNYFTEIEEHFQRARGHPIYLSPLDWALIETWKEAGVPLAAACDGIDQAFAKFASGTRRDRQRPRSLAYCASAVLQAAEAAREAGMGGHGSAARQEAAPPGWEQKQLAGGLARAREKLAAGALPSLAAVVAAEVSKDVGDLLAAWSAAGGGAGAEPGAAAPSNPVGDFPGAADLPSLDRWLSAQDDRLLAALQMAAPAEVLAEVRAGFERELAPHRRNLRTDQLAMVERQFLHKRLLERYGVPRFSLFYLT